MNLTSSEPCGEGPQWGRGLQMWVSRHFHHLAAGAHGNHWASHHGRHATCRSTLKWKLGSRARATITASLHMNWWGSFLHAGNSLSRSSSLHNNHFCCFLNKSCENANNKQMVCITFLQAQVYRKLGFPFKSMTIKLVWCLWCNQNLIFHALALKSIKYTETQCV